MKSLRIVVALGLAFGLSLGSAQAQTRTHKTKHKKQAVVAETQPVVHYRVASSKQYIDGSTLDGRTGMFFTGAAEAPAVGHGNITAGVNLYTGTGYTNFDLPMVGINYGIVKNLELAASLPLQFESPSVGDSQSGLGVFSIGGKYVIPAKSVNFAVGMDIRTGPVSKDLGYRTTVFNPKGLVTYRIPGADGLVLNGEFGVGFWSTGDTTYTIGGYSYTVAGVSDSYVQLKAGVGYPFSPKLTGIAELGINEFGDSGSALAVGIRTGTKTKLQALASIGLGAGAPVFMLGGAVVFPL